MIRKGYMDDPWNTDQAWREVELWHVHFTGNEALSQNFLVISLVFSLLCKTEMFLFGIKSRLL